MTDPPLDLEARSRARRLAFILVTFIAASAAALGMVETAVRAFTPMRESSGRLFEELPDDAIRYRLLPGADAVYIGARATVNAGGYRGELLPDATDEQTLRVVFLGDSMTFGNGVEDSEAYPAVIERRLKDRADGWTCRAANLGVPSYNAEQVAMQLQRIGFPLRPDLVLYGFFVNDAAPKGTSVHWARPSPGWMQWAAELHTVRLLQMNAPQLITTIRESLGVRARSQGYIEYYREGTETRSAFDAALARMKKECDERGVPFGVALIPFWVPFDDYPWADVHAFVREELASMNIPFIDLAEAWKANGVNGRDYWIDIHESHPNPAGHQLIAETIERFLVESLWPTRGLRDRFPFREPE